MKNTLSLISAAAALVMAAALPSFGSLPKVPNDALYPYGGKTFTQFVADSDLCTGGGTPAQFYAWMNQAPLAEQSHGFLALAAAEKQKLASLSGPAQQTVEEQQYCTKLFHMMKTRIPRFSLDTGFEFTNAMRLGTRQCQLQSTILSGLLQRSGIDAGNVMVWRNIGGQEINDGHVVCLVHLADGKAVELDESDPVPFVRHIGLLVDENGLRNVVPDFEGTSPTIIGFKAAANGRRFSVQQVRPLSARYVRSQFYYYRGERAPGGLLASTTTKHGLSTEADYLRRAVHICSENELAVYMLGRVALKQGNVVEARLEDARALRIYAKAGWTPSGPRQLAEAVRPQLRLASRKD